MVFQSYTLFPWLTVRENVEFALRPEAGLSKKERRGVSEEHLRLVGLDGFFDAYPRQLSGGMQQRVAIARALSYRPKILLMDEPFGALDPLTRSTLQREFAALQSRLNKTVIFVTHDVREALLLGTRVALMKAGRVVLLDTPDAFLRSDEPHARAYRETLQLPGGVSPSAPGDRRSGGEP
jgi:ABC-type proline/glycine betaine transport system ATPase subunit